MLVLHTILKRLGISQNKLATMVGMSAASLSRLINDNTWPVFIGKEALQENIVRYLAGQPGARISDFSEMFLTEEELAAQHTTATQPDCKLTTNDKSNNLSGEDDTMLLRKQTLLPATKKAFGIFKDPFSDLTTVDDMWVSPDIRYVREAMYQTAKHGGFLAVVGESGAGKSTVRRDLEHRIDDEKLPIIIVQPYVIAAEDNDTKGKTLKSTHIAEALLSAVAPLARPKSSPQARFAQLHTALKESHNAGYKHCLIIEEAHSLPIPTLKHLKRIMELEVGYTKLVSVILIGQPELTMKLSERNAEVREVVQRCEVVHLPPVEPAKLGEFIDYRLKRASKSVGDVIAPDGIQALVDRLTLPSRNNKDGDISQLYPLAIGNMVVAAMNLAACLGIPVVDKHIVMGV